MSVKGAFKVTVTLRSAVQERAAEMVIRADAVTAMPDGTLYVLGDRQKRRLTPDLWTGMTIENDGGESGLELVDA